MTNLLVLSAGTRGYLFDHFREGLRDGEQVFAADSSPFAPALGSADRAFIVPRADSPDFVDHLLKLCAEHSVDGVVSLNDLELPVLARNRDVLAAHGVTAVISSPAIVDMCFDKYLTHQHLARAGVGTPRTYSLAEGDQLLNDLRAGALTYPIISKPRRGSRSRGIHLIADEESLRVNFMRIRSLGLPVSQQPLYQEYINSDQYSLHVFNDPNGQVISVVAMVNLVRHMEGETFHIQPLRQSDLLALGVQLGESVGHVGPLCADVHRRETGEFVVLELNPRFGGGYSASHFAGADFTGKTLKLVRGEGLSPEPLGDYRDDLVMLKQFSVTAVPRAILDSRAERYS